MGLGEHFPWATVEEVYDERLRATGMSFARFEEAYQAHVPPFAYRKYERTGFATPSGKVELAFEDEHDLEELAEILDTLSL